MKVKLDIPYPEIRVEKENLYYADLLSEDYAGMVSETTAVMLYSYQHFDKFNSDKEFSKIIEEIGRVEMMHLEMLGKTIKLLGKSPIYKVCEALSDNCVFWNSKYVNYKTSLKDMLKIDIFSEESAIKTYTEHKKIIKDKYIREMLSRIILDEKRHLEIFKEMLSNLN